eukprot:2039157-Rhodomonas_salina.1
MENAREEGSRVGLRRIRKVCCGRRCSISCLRSAPGGQPIARPMDKSAVDRSRDGDRAFSADRRGDATFPSPTAVTNPGEAIHWVCAP